MEAEVIAALIAAGSGTAGSLLTAYRDEIKNIFSSTKEFNFLKGHWHCVWDITSHAHVPPRVEDQINITKINGVLIKGEGGNPVYGKYLIEGKASNFALTLQYLGKNSNKDLVGVIILKKETPKKLSGVWCQYTADGLLKSGTVVWEKIPE